MIRMILLILLVLTILLTLLFCRAQDWRDLPLLVEGAIVKAFDAQFLLRMSLREEFRRSRMSIQLVSHSCFVVADQFASSHLEGLRL